MLGEELRVHSCGGYDGPSSSADAHLDEKIIFDKLTLEQQWQLITATKKLAMRMEHVYRRSRVKAGEVKMEDYDTLQRSRRVTSGARGVPGTTIKRI